MSDSVFDEFILVNMPHFIAVNYQRLLEAQAPRKRVELALHIYNLGLRALTIGVVSQYLIRDRERVADPYLNELLLQKFPHLTLDAWQQLLFTSLKAYEGKRDLFFMPELYDFYWDTSSLPHRRRVEVEQPFDHLTQVAIELQVERCPPADDPWWHQLAEETTDLLRQILGGMAFIGKYDLIRVLDYDGLFYDFELHKGLSVSTGRQPLPKHVGFSRGWFYLREGKSIREVAGKLGCSKDMGLRFHDLRHTFASRLIESGFDLITVKDLLGHHSVVTTERYTHSNAEQKRKAVQALAQRATQGQDFVRTVSTRPEDTLAVSVLSEN